MNARKERQYLIFELDDGSTVKYDLSTGITYGKLGKPVKDLKTQLRGLELGDIIDSFEDEKYRAFLNFVEGSQRIRITNPGTLLERAAKMSRFEQFFSAGITSISSIYRKSIGETPKWLLRACMQYGWFLDNDLLAAYIAMPDAFQTVCKFEYQTLDKKRLPQIMKCICGSWMNTKYSIQELIEEHGYTAKALFQYIDHLMTYEAIEHEVRLPGEILDYACMMHEISPKFDKYPRNFLTTHRIACRNYNRLKKQFDEQKFQERRDPSLECKIGRYVFIYPKTPQDIKDEAVQQNNCVASYIDRVIDGRCHILFMRYAGCSDQSLVTIEVRGNKIVQALQRYNQPMTEEQRRAVDAWNKRYENKEKAA